ncbi:hypothetical protein ACH4TP_38175 [Streptomyces sp. NPDC021012]|uniref:hypothetical protein n=1 Tax=Streptomyces sp. NPDC021012 TaxID=3365107 RepID=UPI0037AD9B74
MADRELSPDEMRAVELLMQLQALSPASEATAARITVRMADGTYLGDALLSEDAVNRLNDATFAMATDIPASPAQDDEDHTGGVDWLTIAQIEDIFVKAGLDGSMDGDVL